MTSPAVAGRVLHCAAVLLIVLAACGPAGGATSVEQAARGAASHCGNGVCNSNETCASCPQVCGVCPPVCGDGHCDYPEYCTSCSGDCGTCAACGDGSCNGTETCTTCSADCGSCSPACGDGVCNGTETCSSCPGDCGSCPAACGDGACNGGETCSTCPADCGACPTTTVSCSASFTYGCSSDICPVCDQITAAMNDTDKRNLRANCDWSGGQFVVGNCDAILTGLPAVQGHCYYVAPAFTAVMRGPITFDVDEYYYPDWTPSDAAQECASVGGHWVP